ncbi:MAG: sigma-54-dependent Fis family transcriptional regulator [Betaproteobacteria bacterium]|nr:sigma-54-dependent Fis family transcriptional regulator [Betaproteobacteria bacterium]
MVQFFPVRSPERMNNLRLQQARRSVLLEDRAPDELLSDTVLRSWDRCRTSGLSPAAKHFSCDGMTLGELREHRERNRDLLASAQSVMEYVFEQIRQSGSMVILSDREGTILHTIGDAAFVDRAGRVALSPGACWQEDRRGTNAIGTALVEEQPVEIFGAEHFIERNTFLTCSATPLFDPRGDAIGVLDISGDHRAYQSHTLGLVSMSAQIIERRLFENAHPNTVRVSFHPRAEFLGGPGEGMLALSPEGRILAINAAGLRVLGSRAKELIDHHFSVLFDLPMGSLVDRLRRDHTAICQVLTRNAGQLYLRLSGMPPASISLARVVIDAPRGGLARGREAPGRAAAALSLDSLATGDERLQTAIDRALRVLGRDIPILVLGESGAGKEMFARAFHNSGPRSDKPFVAVNCAAIPEALIESELFGYQGGAFTGARREGAPGKVQQASGGTLFLDEIGDMPLAMQARMLRVLQERVVTPLGSAKEIAVDISLICATHRKLCDEVARGAFREDLYYRLNGLCVTLPPLRERSDFEALVCILLANERRGGAEITVSDGALVLLRSYPWPGNIRQLNNVLRVCLALLDQGEHQITEAHLPDDLISFRPSSTAEPSAATAEASARGGGRLAELELEAIQQALKEAQGNVSAAARRLGISRNTLYRKLGRF